MFFNFFIGDIAEDRNVKGTGSTLYENGQVRVGKGAKGQRGMCREIFQDLGDVTLDAGVSMEVLDEDNQRLGGAVVLRCVKVSD